VPAFVFLNELTSILLYKLVYLVATNYSFSKTICCCYLIVLFFSLKGPDSIDILCYAPGRSGSISYDVLLRGE
jgi:hypothetical protein